MEIRFKVRDTTLVKMVRNKCGIYLKWIQNGAKLHHRCGWTTYLLIRGNTDRVLPLLDKVQLG